MLELRDVLGGNDTEHMLPLNRVLAFSSRKESLTGPPWYLANSQCSVNACRLIPVGFGNACFFKKIFFWHHRHNLPVVLSDSNTFVNLKTAYP